MGVADYSLVKYHSAEVKQHIKALPESIDLQAVIISPLTRALETAIGAFGGDDWTEGDAFEPLMVAQNSIEVAHMVSRFCRAGTHQTCRQSHTRRL